MLRAILAIVPMAIWGGVFVAVKGGERSGMPGIELAAARALPAGMVLAAIALLRIPQIATLRSHWLTLVGMSVSIAAMYGITFVFAPRLPVAVDALLANASPLFAVVLAPVFLRERVTLPQIGGVVLGIGGVLAMALPKIGSAPADVWAMLAMLLGALMLTINTVFMKMAENVDAIVANAVQFLIAGALLLCVSFAAGEHVIWPQHAAELGAVAYVSLGASAFAYLIWMRAVSLLGVSRSSVLLFLVPVFGLLWGWLFLHETITAAEAFGSLLVISGIALASGGASFAVVHELERP